jgi:hypothetical protein
MLTDQEFDEIQARVMAAVKLNPGSDAARKAGCSCPVLDNSHGNGYLGMKGIFVQNLNCKIHGQRKVKARL